jgi:hypothetical protein
MPNTVAPPGMGFGSAVLASAMTERGSANSDVTAKPAAAAAELKNPRRVKFPAPE